MRKKLVAGNWKMNKNVVETRELLSALASGLDSVGGAERALCPPFTSLFVAAEALTGTGIGLGAQNMHWEEKGAFTGEISPSMVKEFCAYVILGHSERRMYFGETDETVNKKLLAAQKADLTPVVCVGETLAQYEAGETRQVVVEQIRAGLQGVAPEFAPRIVVAYEPIWAIGTGKASSAENAQAVHGEMIRPTLSELFGEEAAQAIRILYGGSVNAANAADFFAQPDIDGALVGGASLKADEFIAIAKAAAE
ncbi:MAG: triose-phosphate isomerase [Anaerolineales bacterium]|nr:triose-phosphate isomerase [Anaerolineales bacterium]